MKCHDYTPGNTSCDYSLIKLSHRGRLLYNVVFTLVLRSSMTSSIMNLMRTGKSPRHKSCWVRSKY